MKVAPNWTFIMKEKVWNETTLDLSDADDISRWRVSFTQGIKSFQYSAKRIFQ